MKVFAIILCFLMFPFTLLLGPERLRDYAHRELVYKVIASKVTKGAITDREKALRLMSYVATHLSRPTDIVDVHPLNDLIRGVGWCDQQANTLITLARKCGIKGHLIFLRGYDMISHHSVCDLHINGEWRIFDPFYDLIFHKGNEIATFEDFQKRPDTLYSKRFEELQLSEPEEVERYFDLFEPTWEPTIFRDNFSQTRTRKIVSGIVDFYYTIFGDSFLWVYQSLYFKLADIDDATQERLLCLWRVK